jgi:hypothetical protein
MRKTQTLHDTLLQVIHRWSLPSLIDFRVWKPENPERGSNPDVAVWPFRQRMGYDFLRRIRVHLGKAVSIEAKHAVRRRHNQKAVSRLHDVIDDVRREAVCRRERLTEVVGCGLSWI